MHKKMHPQNVRTHTETDRQTDRRTLVTPPHRLQKATLACCQELLREHTSDGRRLRRPFPAAQQFESTGRTLTASPAYRSHRNQVHMEEQHPIQAKKNRKSTAGSLTNEDAQLVQFPLQTNAQLSAKHSC